MEKLNSNKNLLLIGANGFIGSRLKKFLPDNLNVFNVSFSKPSNNELQYQIDCRNLHEFNKLPTNEFQYVINLGGYIDHATGFNGGIKIFENHTQILINVLKYIDRNKVISFINVGSSDEYGDHHEKIKPSTPPNPISCYSLSKTTSYNLLKLLHQEDGFPFNFIRLFLTYGPRQNPPRLVPYVIQKCINDEEFTISSSNFYRDFCYIDDVCEGITAALYHTSYDNIFHIASGIKTNLKDLVQVIQKSIGKGKPKYEQSNLGVQSLIASIESTQDILEWSPKVPLIEGIQKTISFQIRK